MGQRDRHIFEKLLSPPYRYDKIFCDLLDQGMDPSEAAEQAAELIKEPIKPIPAFTDED